MSEKKENWESRFGFILAAAGFSIGLGNIWRFPWLTSKFGGGAFVLAYVLICLFIGVPLFLAELGIGRSMKATPIVGLLKQKHGVFWSLIGWIGTLACVILMAYYTVIIGWMLRYAVKAVVGTFNNCTPEMTKAMFAEFMQRPMELLAYTAVAFIAMGTVIARGVKNGVEKACKWLLPILGIMIICLAVRSLTLKPLVEGGKTAMEGLKWYLTPDFSKLANSEVWLRALGQAFFSIGIGISTAIVYGSYLNDDFDMPSDCSMIIAMDTLFALLAGVVIFPALFVNGSDPDSSGVGLVLEVMPVVFGRMPMGQFWASLFFFLVSIAGFTSGLGYIEAPVASYADLFKVSRKKMTWIVIFIIFLLSIPCVYSLGSGENIFTQIKLWGMSIFDYADYLSGNVMMPVDALLVALYTTFVWKFENYEQQANMGAKGVLRVHEFWKPWVLYAVPLILIVILYRNI